MGVSSPREKTRHSKTFKDLSLLQFITIGNYDQESVSTWYSKLKSFSITVMKDVTSYCDKTIAETKHI